MTPAVVDRLRTLRFPALGTTAALVVDGDEQELDAARVVLEKELAAIDRAASRFRPDSELSLINRDPRPRVAAGPLLLEAVTVALRGARLTGGLVDPTMGRAIRVLGYDRDWASMTPDDPAAPGVVPTPSLRVPGWQAVTVDSSRGTISRPPGLELDLGATAKALAADRAATAAAAQLPGVGVLVSLGGDVALAGPAPDGGWPVRVSDDQAATPGAAGAPGAAGPAAAPGAAGASDPAAAHGAAGAAELAGQTVSLWSGGLATSGTTVRRWRRGGTELHHILDPATGRPAPVVWRTVSVAAGTCVDANIASTAAIVLGHDAPAWLEARGLPSRLVGPAGQVYLVAGWPPAWPSTPARR